jgi:hypothetical protein
MLTRQGTLAGRLNQIVGVTGRAREPARKTPQPGQNRDKLIAESRRHGNSLGPADRRLCVFPAQGQRASLSIIPCIILDAAGDRSAAESFEANADLIMLAKAGGSTA